MNRSLIGKGNVEADGLHLGQMISVVRRPLLPGSRLVLLTQTAPGEELVHRWGGCDQVEARNEIVAMGSWISQYSGMP